MRTISTFALLSCVYAVPLHKNTTSSNASKTSSPEYVGFLPNPEGRGTVSLVISCLLTLFLCVSQALHLNVPKRGETLWERLLTNLLWITIGVYAPELVVFTAWRQWSSAKLLGKIVREEDSKKEAKAVRITSQQNDGHIDNGDACVDHIEHHQLRPNRKYPWTMVHSFFASTGGFAIDIDNILDRDSKKKAPFLPAECPRRITLTARAVALLARCDLLPDIPGEEIQDKSKANNLAKSLVVLQATWMLVQVIGRLTQHLPVTLLEVNTIAHVLCAFLMYAMWWDKPLLPREPVILKGDWVESLCAYMFMSSELSGCVEKPTVDSQSMVKRLFASMKLYSKVPETERLHIRLDEKTISTVQNNQQLSKKEGKIAARPSTLAHTFEISSPLSRTELRAVREADKSSETAFFERRPRITASDRTTALPNPVQARRWELAAEAMRRFPVLRDSLYILHRHIPPNAPRTCFLHSRPVEFVKPYIQNWPYDDLLRDVGGLTVGMILWLSNFVYGGLHASAWNEHFPTMAEKWLWRVSCSYISFAGALWIILNWMAAAYSPLNDFWERWMDGRKGKVWGFFLGCIVFICGVSFFAARVFLVLEAFLSIRDLPRSAYNTLNWSQMVPHF